jgi:hypothetical protein
VRSQWRVSQPLSAFQIRNECGVPSYASTESLRNPCDGKRVTDQGAASRSFANMGVMGW